MGIGQYYPVVAWARDSVLDPHSLIWGHRKVTVARRFVIARFSRKHPAARKPVARFLTIAEAAEWPHFPAIKEDFPATDYAPNTGTLIFDIGGNKYRLFAWVNFQMQHLVIREVLTHEEYDRIKL
jgi:mRNA interferase HigB